MPRKKKHRQRPRHRIRTLWNILTHPAFRTTLRALILAILVVTVLTAAWSGVARLEAHVHHTMRDQRPDPTATFLDMPPTVAELAADALNRTVAPLLARPWTDDHLCSDIADALAANTWVEHVDYVRRTPEPRFRIRCRYRVPVALVQSGAEFFLVNAAAVRLPGTYTYDPAWPLIQGVAAPRPPPAEPWTGKDLRAGLDVLAAIQNDPFRHQITGILVDNVGGRIDRMAPHLELATDRAGGRIRWGSAPGAEIEENSVSQKLAILRENYRTTGHVDAGHLVIDISTYPDRYRIPG